MMEELGGPDLPLELTLHLLGLRAVADSKVGSATVRGVSGGERHRVTTAEMIVGTFHRPIFCPKRIRLNLNTAQHSHS